MIESNFTLRENAGMLVVATVLFLIWLKMPRSNRVWGVRVMRYTALGLLGFVIFADTVLSLLSGRLLTGFIGFAVAAVLCAHAIQEVKAVREEYQYQREHAERRLAVEDAARQQEGAEEPNDAVA